MVFSCASQGRFPLCNESSRTFLLREGRPATFRIAVPFHFRMTQTGYKTCQKSQRFYKNWKELSAGGHGWKTAGKKRFPRAFPLTFAPDQSGWEATSTSLNSKDFGTTRSACLSQKSLRTCLTICGQSNIRTSSARRLSKAMRRAALILR